MLTTLKDELAKIKFCSIFSKLLSIIKKFHLSIHQKNATNREAQKSATLPNIFLSCFIALYANITATRLSFHVLPQSEPSWKLQFDWLIIGLFRRWHEIFIMLRVKEILEIDPMEIAETQWKFHWEFRNWNEVALDVIPLNCNEFFFLSGSFLGFRNCPRFNVYLMRGSNTSTGDDRELWWIWCCCLRFWFCLSRFSFSCLCPDDDDDDGNKNTLQRRRHVVPIPFNSLNMLVSSC